MKRLLQVFFLKLTTDQLTLLLKFVFTNTTSVSWPFYIQLYQLLHSFSPSTSSLPFLIILQVPKFPSWHSTTIIKNGSLSLEFLPSIILICTLNSLWIPPLLRWLSWCVQSELNSASPKLSQHLFWPLAYLDFLRILSCFITSSYCRFSPWVKSSIPMVLATIENWLPNWYFQLQPLLWASQLKPTPYWGLAGSVSRLYNSWSQGCGYEPHIRCRHYFEKSKIFKNKTLFLGLCALC